MIEYYQRRAFGKHVDASRLFLYKVTRNLIGWTGDTGAYLRDTMKALVMCGVPPEQYWPYDIAKYDDEPSAFLYALGDDYEAVKYYRLDPPGTTRAARLEAIKTNLAAGLPSMFGFTVYSSMPASGDGKGEIPYPTSGDTVQGGHAVLAVGYDDAKKIGTSQGRAAHPQLLGHCLGRGGLRLAAVRLRPEGARERFLVARAGGLRGYGSVQVMSDPGAK